jgi:hypothetical protein
MDARKFIDSARDKALERIVTKRNKREGRRGSVKIRKKSDVVMIAEVYSFLYREGYKSDPPMWGRKELGQCKNLIKKVGCDRAEKLVRYVFRDWAIVSREIGLSGVPLIGDILGRCLRYADKEEKVGSGWGEVARI